MLNHNGGAGTDGSKSNGKIKKRGLSSSSATSSSLRKFRLKRAVFVGKRGGGATTPAPVWKKYGGSRSSYTNTPESSQIYQSHDLLEGMEGSISARKLVNALWQLNEGPKISDLSYRGGASEVSESYRASRHRSKEPIYDQNISYLYSEGRSRSSHSQSIRDNAIQIHQCNLSHSPKISSRERRNRLKDLNNSLTASREILKAMIHISGPEQMDSSTISLLSALCSELDRARTHLHQIRKQSLEEKEEREIWKNQEKERIFLIVKSVTEELETEKKARRQTERLSKKLGVALTQTEESLMEAKKELERERRSRERVERVCKELMRGIGEDRAEVEELKRETVNLQEELEKEREMLHLADEWREERVHMKLLEARCQFEEKNKAIDQLRNELEAYLSAKKGLDSNIEDCKGENVDVNVNFHACKEESDEDSDLQSIELDMNCTEESKEIEEGSNGNLPERISWKFTRKDLELLGGEFDKENFHDATILHGKDREIMYGEDVERYMAVKGLRDHMLAGSRYFIAQDREGQIS